ncbi:MAG: hypothetical protein HN742_06640 [Lentisphaerae bacterium]|jgi:hypothetical protein|nr:hypothetical protein [Lentisphaerota bacterium]MBT4818912.1 hypothetical protein [Lentisphaerota bacterium]MBT5612675.1 hypothetical protein [Lentisphaerota bacterium]MBT7056937.1 hypothetical protein [Lentisphaerota bacterium]MBT7841530.1 hypothetical protein [Lentisphaerota bacterium]
MPHATPPPDDHHASATPPAEERAVHGLLMELGRPGAGDEEAFVGRLMERLQKEQGTSPEDSKPNAPVPSREACPVVRTRLSWPGLRRFANAAVWLLLGCAAAALFGVRRHVIAQHQIAEQAARRETRLWETAGVRLGEHLAREHPGASVLIVAKPTYLPLVNSDPLVSGLLRGMGEAMSDVRVEACPAPAALLAESALLSDPALGPAPMHQSIPAGQRRTEYWFSARWLERVLDVYASDRDLVITGLGLPAALGTDRSWWNESRPKLALASGSLAGFGDCLRRGDIVAAIGHRPVESEAPSTDSESPPRFEDRFLLVTPDNVDRTVLRHPNLFQK